MLPKAGLGPNTAPSRRMRPRDCSLNRVTLSTLSHGDGRHCGVSPLNPWSNGSRLPPFSQVHPRVSRYAPGSRLWKCWGDSLPSHFGTAPALSPQADGEGRDVLQARSGHGHLMPQGLGSASWCREAAGHRLTEPRSLCREAGDW